MVKFTNEQRLEIIKQYYKNSESVVETLKALTPIFGHNKTTKQDVRAVVNKFETTYSLLDDSVSVRQCTVGITKKIADVKTSFRNKSIQSKPYKGTLKDENDILKGSKENKTAKKRPAKAAANSEEGDAEPDAKRMKEDSD